jgi:hypothetical protein
MLDFENGGYKCFLPGPGTDWDLDVPRFASKALWSLAKSTKNRESIRRAGAIPLLAKLMKTKQVSVVIPTVGILQECAAEVRLASKDNGSHPLIRISKSDQIFSLNYSLLFVLQYARKVFLRTLLMD